MWGALTFLLLFLVIDPTTREMIASLLEDARLQLAVEAPLPYFLLVIVVGSAVVSALIMKFWPKTEAHTRRIKILHRYQGRAASDFPNMPPAPALPHLIFGAAGLLMPVRARIVCGKVLRNLGGLAGIRLRGA